MNKEVPQTYNYLVEFEILQLKMDLLKGLFMFLKTSVFCPLSILVAHLSPGDPVCSVVSGFFFFSACTLNT